VRDAVDHHAPADCRRWSAERAHRERVAHHRHALGARRFVPRLDQPSRHGPNAEHAEESRSHPSDADALGLAVRPKGRLTSPHGADRREAPLLLEDGEEIDRGQGGESPEEHNGKIVVRGVAEHRVHRAEHRGRRADAERQDEDCREGEAGASAQASACVTQIAEHALDPSDAARVPVCLLVACDATEGYQRAPPGLVRRQAVRAP
jgi:hypothetical protein